jgi:hypothetical protein
VIVDSHAHVFEKWSGACGLPSRALHWRYLQKNLCRPAAKVFRHDGTPSTAAHLYRSGTTTWDGLRDDIDFRVGPYGRIEFTVDGEDHYVQYMPAAMAQIESTPESMITQMNAAGVDHCLLQAGFTYAQADHAWNALDAHIHGFTLQKLNFPFDPAEFAAAAQAYLPMIPADTYPHMHAMSKEVAAGRHAGVLEFTFGLDLILDGLERLLAKRRR